MAQVPPYYVRNKDERCCPLQQSCDKCTKQYGMLVTKSHLIDPYSTAHRAHASKVCSAASAVVEGHISARIMEDKEVHGQNMRGRHITEVRVSQKVTEYATDAALFPVQAVTVASHMNLQREYHEKYISYKIFKQKSCREITVKSGTIF